MEENGFGYSSSEVGTMSANRAGCLPMLGMMATIAISVVIGIVLLLI